MATSFKWEVGALVTVADTELNSLANGAFATGKEYDNSLSANLFFFGDFELVLATGSAMTANNTVDLYLLEKVDGANNPDVTGPPPNLFVGSFVVQANAAARLVLRGVPLPPTKFTPYIKNGSGVALSASASTLKLLPYRQTGV